MSASNATSGPREAAPRPAAARPAARPAAAPARPATRSAAPTQRPAARSERSTLSPEARGSERSNGHAAVAGLAGNFASNSVEAGGRRSSVRPASMVAPAGVRSQGGRNFVGAQGSIEVGGRSPNEQGRGWHSVDAALNPRIRQALERVAPGYATARGQNLVIVSGERNHERSAATLNSQDRSERRHLYQNQNSYNTYERAISEADALARREDPIRGLLGRHGVRANELLSSRIQHITHGNRNNFISEHQSGHSFDVSVTRGHMSRNDIDEATRRFQAAGMRVLFEGDHLHVDIPRRDGSSITSANPTITFREAQTINRFQREEEIRAGAPRQPHEHRDADPNLARRRTQPSTGQENSRAANLDRVERMVSSFAWLSTGGAQYALPQLP